MIDFLLWYLFISLLGWLSFPIAHRLLSGLPGKGYSLSKALGLLLWGFFFWFLTSVGLLQNDLAGQLLALVILVCLSLWAGWKDKFAALRTWIKENVKFILAIEILFLIAFGLWSFVRASNPAIIGTEKPMEMAFINAILRSPGFPPNDPWLSGYAISYYYFGYVLIAMLIRITGVSSGVGYNLSAALWFALTAIGSYGVIYNLVKARWLDKKKDKKAGTPTWLYFAALLAPFLILIVSNLHAVLDVLHARGLFWTTTSDGIQVSEFWEWLKLRELDQPPSSPYSWLPTRPGGVQWWGASRVLQDFRYNHEAIEVIDEFPNFSYLLSDLHPHVLAMPFVLMIINQALNLFLGGMQGKIKIFKIEIPFSFPGLLLSIVSLGGLAFLNTWDFPFYLALMGAAFLVQRYYSEGWEFKRILEFVYFMLGLGIPSILLYLPFFLSFASQAGGVFPSLIFYTRGVYFWIMFAPFLVPLLVYLIYEWVGHKKGRQILKALLSTLGFIFMLFGLTWLLSYFASRLPDLAQQFMWLQGAGDISISTLLWEALRRRLVDPVTLMTLGLMMFLCLGLLIKEKMPRSEEQDNATAEAVSHPVNQMTLFALLLILWGVLLTMGPEFVYLRDQFAVRMNTIFKFYFQAWILWSLATGYAIIVLWRKSSRWGVLVNGLLGLVGILSIFILGFTIASGYTDTSSFTGFDDKLFGVYPQDWAMAAIGLIVVALIIGTLIRKKWLWTLRIVIVLTIGLGLVYPIIALWNKTNGFKPYGGLTLDGTAYYRLVSPDQMDAVDWLKEAPLGVMVEAVSPTGGSYTGYARVSTLSGMPTVLGWIGHVLQWRGGGEEMGTRQADIEMLYSTSSWMEAKRIIDNYNIRYIYIGDLERSTYLVNEEKFQMQLRAVFENPNAIIYEVPAGQSDSWQGFKDN